MVRPYVQRNKSDQTDAKGILEAYRNKDIKPVPVKSIEQQSRTALHRVRSSWVASSIMKVGVSAMALTTVQRILELCDQLSEDDREILEERLAQRAEAAWRGEVEDARRQAEERGIDQDAIDQAIHKHRHGA